MRGIRAIVVSIALTLGGARGFLQVLPWGTKPGATSAVNSDRSGVNASRLTTVPFDASGCARAYTLTSTRTVADLQRYLAPGAFDDVTDRRLLDTRLR